MGAEYTEAQKRATLNWRIKNKEKFNLYMKSLAYDYYHSHQEIRSVINAKNYLYKKESRIFRNILIDNL
jgi:hypothetical protein